MPQICHLQAMQSKMHDTGTMIWTRCVMNKRKKEKKNKSPPPPPPPSDRGEIEMQERFSKDLSIKTWLPTLQRGNHTLSLPLGQDVPLSSSHIAAQTDTLATLSDSKHFPPPLKSHSWKKVCSSYGQTHTNYCRIINESSSYDHY